MHRISNLLVSIKPISLLLSALTYILGGGIAHYLGAKMQWAPFLLGLLTVLFIQAVAGLLTSYFRLSSEPLQTGETFTDRKDARKKLIQVTFACLSLIGVILMVLSLTGAINLLTAILLILALLLLMVYAIPPFRAAERGFGELILAFMMAVLFPALAYLLLAREFQTTISLITFPLTLLAIAYFLAADFPEYATHVRLDHQSLLRRLTWQRAIPMHHILILAAYLLVGSLPLTGIAWRVIWPVFLSLPFAIAQIFWLQQIGKGGRTMWSLFKLILTATYVLFTYFLSLSFWSH